MINGASRSHAAGPAVETAGTADVSAPSASLPPAHPSPAVLPGAARTPTGRPARVTCSPAEAARILGIARSTFDRLWKNGTLPALGIKEARRITWRRQFDRATVEQALWSRRLA